MRHHRHGSMHTSTDRQLQIPTIHPRNPHPPTWTIQKCLPQSSSSIPNYEAGVTSHCQQHLEHHDGKRKKIHSFLRLQNATFFLLDKIQDLVVLKRTSTGRKFVLCLYLPQVSSIWRRLFARVHYWKNTRIKVGIPKERVIYA